MEFKCIILILIDSKKTRTSCADLCAKADLMSCSSDLVCLWHHGRATAEKHDCAAVRLGLCHGCHGLVKC